MFDFYVFPTILDDFKCHENSLMGGFLQTFGTNPLPRCRRDSRESVQSEVGHGIFPIGVSLFHPPKWVGDLYKSTLAIPASNKLEMLVIVCPESKEMNHQDEARQQQVLDVSGFPHVKDHGVS